MDANSTAGPLAILTLISAVAGLVSLPIVWVWKLRHWADVIKRFDDEFPPLQKSAESWKHCVDQMPGLLKKLETLCDESINAGTKVEVMWEVFVKDSLSEMWRTKLGQSHSENRLTETGTQLLNNQEQDIAGKLRDIFSASQVDATKLSDAELTLIISRLLQDDIAESAKTNDLPLRAILGAALTYVRELPSSPIKDKQM